MGDPNYESEAIVAMDRWLASVEADDSGASLADKILANRPADIQDRCSQIPGLEQVTVPGIGTVCEHEQVQTRYGTPRTVAGEPISTDQNKCQLQPLSRTDYYPIEFTDDRVGAAAGRVPDRCLRLERARRLPAGGDPVADLPGRRRAT